MYVCMYIYICMYVYIYMYVCILEFMCLECWFIWTCVLEMHEPVILRYWCSIRRCGLNCQAIATNRR